MIVLATTSKTRQAMLRNAGIRFTSESPEVDEQRLVSQNPHWTALQTPYELAKAKAEDISQRRPTATTIGADQILLFEGRIFAKPFDLAECRQQLLLLNGKKHELVSSVVCVKNGKEVWSAAETATLTMRNFTDEFLDQYLIAHGSKCLTSVGGYQIEGPGIQLFETVTGDHFTILGLPLLQLLAYLRTANEILT